MQKRKLILRIMAGWYIFTCLNLLAAGAGDSAPDPLSKIDPKVRDRLFTNRPIQVTILCRTQLLSMPDGYGEFREANNTRHRSSLRQDLIAQLKTIAENGEQSAVIKKIGRAKVDQHWIVNAVSTRIPGRKIKEIAGLDEVKYIYTGFPNLPGPDLTFLSEVLSPSEKGEFSTRGYKVPWNLKAIGAEKVWNNKKVTGEGVIVAVLEGAGVDYTHKDLRNNVWINTDEKPDNGRDDDGNGYVDDYYGFNFSKNNSQVIATGPRQHGTATAGLLVGDGSGGVITGVAPRAKLMILSGPAVYAYQYALENGADILSMSFSIPDLGNTRGLWRLMSEQAVCAGLVLVSGCGNFQKSELIPEQIRIPEGIPCVIGAGGLDRSMNVPPFCSLGPVEWASVEFYNDYPLPVGLIKPDICAFPGPGYPVTAPGRSGYVSNLRGNSFSSPHIAGVAALIFSAVPELPAWRIQTVLEETARDVGQKGKDPTTGSGLVDAWKAVSHAQSLK